MSSYRGDEYFIDDRGVLMHYGTPGMKWGKSKNPNYRPVGHVAMDIRNSHGGWDQNQYNAVNPNRSYDGHRIASTRTYSPRGNMSGTSNKQQNAINYLNTSAQRRTAYNNANAGMYNAQQQEKARKNRELIARGAIGNRRSTVGNGYTGDQHRRKASLNDNFGQFLKNDIQDRAYNAKWAAKRALVNTKAKARAAAFKAKRAWKNGLGGEIRNTADRFVSDTADFYRNAYKKLKNKFR